MGPYGPPVPSYPPPRPGGSRSAVVPVLLAGAALIGVAIGIAVGRGTAGSEAVTPTGAPPVTDAGRLEVMSTPAGGMVMVDGRFVGLTPIARLDLDPGKHAVVIDVFGYQPYAGTIAIEPSGAASLEAVLAPIGGGGSTGGKLAGRGTATNAAVPASALTPTAAAAAGAGGGAGAAGADGADGAAAEKKGKRRRRSDSDSYSSYSPAPAYAPPPRPRRDCGGEKSRCRDACSRAESSCRFDCPHCVSCSSSVGTDECKRQCESCRSGCDQNTDFCEASCDGQHDNCNAANSM